MDQSPAPRAKQESFTQPGSSAQFVDRVASEMASYYPQSRASHVLAGSTKETRARRRASSACPESTKTARTAQNARSALGAERPTQHPQLRAPTVLWDTRPKKAAAAAIHAKSGNMVFITALMDILAKIVFLDYTLTLVPSKNASNVKASKSQTPTARRAKSHRGKRRLIVTQRTNTSTTQTRVRVNGNASDA
jgi:hypothetical protein